MVDLAKDEKQQNTMSGFLAFVNRRRFKTYSNNHWLILHTMINKVKGAYSLKAGAQDATRSHTVASIAGR